MNSPTDWLQLVLFLGLPTGVAVLVLVLRYQARKRVVELVREAVMADKPLSPDVVTVLTGARRSSTERDIRRGALLIAVGLALGLIGICAGVALLSVGAGGGLATGMGLAGLGALPLCIGAALILLSRVERD